MKAQRLLRPLPIDDQPLRLEEVEVPAPGSRDLLLRVLACGLCHTDLHIVEGELDLPRLPLIPGHQIVGVVESVGTGARLFAPGDRVGVPWLFGTCGACEQCHAGKENLCDSARFTGYHVDGGFAGYVVVHEQYAFPLPTELSDANAAPLLCAGVIGYRALRMSEIREGERLGLYGFGASAHIAIQIARHWSCQVFVFTRSAHHRALAENLGACWTGRSSDAPPKPLHAAVIFAPAGELVPAALKAVGKGGTVALAGIHMSPIPSLEYRTIYHERTLRSVANSTRHDVREMINLAEQIQVRTEVETYPLAHANEALGMLKRSEIRGSGVLLVG